MTRTRAHPPENAVVTRLLALLLVAASTTASAAVPATSAVAAVAAMAPAPAPAAVPGSGNAGATVPALLVVIEPVRTAVFHRLPDGRYAADLGRVRVVDTRFPRPGWTVTARVAGATAVEVEVLHAAPGRGGGTTDTVVRLTVPLRSGATTVRGRVELRAR